MEATSVASGNVTFYSLPALLISAAGTPVPPDHKSRCQLRNWQAPAGHEDSMGRAQAFLKAGRIPGTARASEPCEVSFGCYLVRESICPVSWVTAFTRKASEICAVFSSNLCG